VPDLADTSAWLVARREPAVRQRFERAVAAGSVAICDMVKLELLRTARNPREFEDIRFELDSLRNCPLGQREWNRALDVYEEICRSGPGNDHHRSVSHPDLLVAAAAEAAGVSLLHYDSDYDTIGKVTGQPMRWLAPRGSL